MAMDDDVFKQMFWLHGIGLLETINVIGIALGMTRIDVNGVLVFEHKEN